MATKASVTTHSSNTMVAVYKMRKFMFTIDNVNNEFASVVYITEIGLNEAYVSL